MSPSGDRVPWVYEPVCVQYMVREPFSRPGSKERSEPSTSWDSRGQTMDRDPTGLTGLGLSPETTAGPAENRLSTLLSELVQVDLRVMGP